MTTQLRNEKGWLKKQSSQSEQQKIAMSGPQHVLVQVQHIVQFGTMT